MVYCRCRFQELLVLEASYGRSCLNALAFLKKSIKDMY
jgi:hypothetical protein